MYLTHLDYADTESIMTEKLHNQVNGTEWSWKNLNTVTIAPSWKFVCILGIRQKKISDTWLLPIVFA